MLTVTGGRLTWLKRSVNAVAPQVTSVRHSKASKRRKDDQRINAPHLTFENYAQKPCDLALAYFDDHYFKAYNDRWPSMRLGLLSKNKPCALVNNFANRDQIEQGLKKLGCQSLRDDLPKSLDQALDEVEEEISADVHEPFSGSDRPSSMEIDDSLDEIGVKDISMRKDDEVLRGRIVAPEEQILGEEGSMSLHEFVPTKKLIGMEDFVEESAFYESYEKIDTVPVKQVAVKRIALPKALNAFYFPRNVLESFPRPSRTMSGVFDYYCMDLASLLPVIALGLRPHETVLDMCAGPGGKSLAILQTLLPSKLVCNDVSGQRLQRARWVMNMYTEGADKRLIDTVEFKKFDGIALPNFFPNTYDKVLCDVPCLTDRHVVRETTESNVFSGKRKKERLLLPQRQIDLLVAALKCTRPGGSVVYSTCSLSPIQNDGVVFGALRKVWEETSIEYYINDLSTAFEPYHDVLHFAKRNHNLKFGQLIVPNITQNFGPMYFAKITRTV